MVGLENLLPCPPSSGRRPVRRTGVFLLLLTALVLLFFGGRPAPVAAVSCVLIALSLQEGKGALRSLAPVVLLGVLLFLAVLVAVLVWSVGWEGGMHAAALLASRIIVLGAVAHLLARNLDAEGILRWTGRLGLKRLGLALSLALNALPALSAAVQEVWIGHRNRFRSRGTALLRSPGLLELLLAHAARISADAAAAAALRGHSLVVKASGFPLPPGRPMLVLTGPANVGKTTILEEVCSLLGERGLRMSGFLQPKSVGGDGRRSFRIRNIRDGEERPLAVEAPDQEGSFGTSFLFDAGGLRLGEEALGESRDGDFLVVDELGPVELRGGGHFPALQESLRRATPSALIVVLRRHLVPDLIARLDAVDVRLIDGEEAQEEAAARLLKEIEEILGLED